MIRRTPLPADWLLSSVGDSPTGGVRDVPAVIPGCVHTDLLAAGAIPDPYLDANELAVQWIGDTDWEYRTVLNVTADDGYEVTELEFDGLDTVAKVTLNDRVVGETANMHRSYRLDVTDAVRAGGNDLAVRFRSAIAYGEAHRDRLGDIPHNYPLPMNFIRKMASNFGWDWGPTLVTAGIWRPARLLQWRTARLESVRPLVTVDGSTGTVEVHVEVARSTPGMDVPLTVRAIVGDARAESEIPPGAKAAVLRFEVPDVHMWWPRGYGDQPLYELKVELAAPATDLDEWSRRIGFRTAVLDITPDADGAPFTFVVNDTPILIKGSNWIPDDSFVSRVDRGRYRARLEQACASHHNLLRVWGGGIYESDDFFELCDELGLLVWQDFLFACASYPEEEPIRSEVIAEARENVTRLANHPSLVLWNGNNENIWGWFDWGWQPDVEGRTWGLGYYLEILPAIVSELDPTRPYWPGSPYSGSLDVHPNADTHGPKHIWDVWNTADWTHYRTYRPRFVSEFGWQAPPTYTTLHESLSDRPLRSDSPFMLHHQKARDGNGKLERGLAHHFPRTEDFDGWHYLTQVNQARAVTAGIDHFRALWPYSGGTIVWQLNDCWPVTSWAAIDSNGREKPLFHAITAAYSPRRLSIQPNGDSLNVTIGNDTDRPWEGAVLFRRIDVGGNELARSDAPVSVSRRSASRLPIPAGLANPGEPTRELLVAELLGERALWFFADDTEFEYPQAQYDIHLEHTAELARIHLTARSLLRDVVLQVDRVSPSAHVDSGFITLLPGDTHSFTVYHTGILTTDDISHRVLSTVNDVVRATREAHA